MSRIAYIISAYKDAPHLSRLIKAYILTGKQTAVRSKNCCRKARSPLYKAIG